MCAQCEFEQGVAQLAAMTKIEGQPRDKLIDISKVKQDGPQPWQPSASSDVTKLLQQSIDRIRGATFTAGHEQEAVVKKFESYAHLIRRAHEKVTISKSRDFGTFAL